MFHCEVIDNSEEKITIEKAQKFIESQKCGASLYFLGTVRDHNNDKTVVGITYDAHDAMVKKSFKEIYDIIFVKFYHFAKDALNISCVSLSKIIS